MRAPAVFVCDLFDYVHPCRQDEMKALQRLNTAYFLTGYLGFVTTWVLSLISMILSRPSLGAAADRTKAVLQLLSPHYCFAQGLYDISNTAQGSGECGGCGGAVSRVWWCLRADCRTGACHSSASDVQSVVVHWSCSLPGR